VNGEEENTALVGAVWGAHDGSLPMEQVIPNWTGRALSWRVTTQVLQFFVDTLERHYLLLSVTQQI
jgi:hypothetical protein